MKSKLTINCWWLAIKHRRLGVNRRWSSRPNRQWLVVNRRRKSRIFHNKKKSKAVLQERPASHLGSIGRGGGEGALVCRAHCCGPSARQS